MAINRDKVLEAAQKFVEKKKYDKAVAELRKLVDADPNDARTLLKIGDLQAKQGLHADAINTYESVGKLYANQGFALKAIAVYKQIREIIAKHVPQLEERYGHIAPKLAELYQQLGLTSDALAALDEVATKLQRQQKDQEAIDVFRKIVELDPTNPLPHLRLAEALSRVKDIEGAVFEFKTAAQQLTGIGRRDDALKVLERLLHHRPDPEQAKICAELYLSRGQPQDGMQALAKLQVCFQANPRDFDTLSLLARAFNAIGQGAKAIEVQKEMARVARDTGKTDLFKEILERLLRVAPHDEGVRRLAQQQNQGGGGGAQLVAPPEAPAPEPRYPAPPPYAQRNDPAAAQPNAWPQKPATANVGFQPPAPTTLGARPETQPLARPMTANAFQQPPPLTQAKSLPPNEDEEVDELSYDAYQEEVEEVAGDEVQEYASDAPQAGGGYQHQQPGAYAESNDYVDGGQAESIEEEEMPPSSEDIVELVQKTLADANAFRRVRLYAKALETLRAGLDIDPRSMDLHEVYRDVLIESNQTEEAVEEMLVIASLYVDALDGESAARALQDVLAFDPSNGRAIGMLQELGYEIVDEDAETGGQADVHTELYAGEYAAEDGEGRLPSYELEEPAEARGGSAHPAAFGEAAGTELPSFPLDEPDHDPGYASGAPMPRFPDAEAYPEPAYNEAEEPGEQTHARSAATDADQLAPAYARSSAPPRISNKPMSAGSSRELEDALDEAEFFCSRNLFDDAKAILTEQLSKHPNNPLLRERLAEISAADEQRGGSGTRERPRAEAAYDLGSSLDALESLDYDKIAPAEGHAEDDQQVDVEEVFAKFKEGVAKQIMPDDSSAHYDLGIAYKEMSLLDDAIREFEVAATDPKRECVCRSMVGMIEIERGRINEAIDAFLLGLNAPLKDAQQETVLCYEIGAAYEAKKQTKDALSYYQKAMRRDPNYRDVQERVRRLAKAAEPKTNLRQVAVNADDEFDRAFEGLLGKA